MKEIREIVKAMKRALEDGKRMALATVVKVEGSSYRRPGARMLITEDGGLTGAISGGCLEGDALRKALYVMGQQKPMLVTYDTNDEDDAKIGVGLGCNGVIHILIEPLSETDSPFVFFTRLMQSRDYGVAVTLFSLEKRHSVQPGTCMFLLGNEFLERDLPEDSTFDEIKAEARNTWNRKRSVIKTFLVGDEEIIGFFDVIPPSLMVNIVGAGNDVVPLVKMADILGWETRVIDGRPRLLQKSRFPEAKELLHSKADEILQKVACDENTAFVLMTHNYNYELALLRELLYVNIPYLGILGPRKKLNRMLSELKEDGLEFAGEHLQKVYGPVGFDIGAETSEEIALSIVSEIKAVFSKSKGTSLRDKSGAIHEPTPEFTAQLSEFIDD